MSISCLGSAIQVQEQCTPTCSRWTGVNQGEPIRVYQHVDTYDPNYYPRVAAVTTDPNQLLLTAMAYWEQLYPCGQLFEIVTDRSIAHIELEHFPGDETVPTPLGSATCLCEPQNTTFDQCSVNGDHSAVWQGNGGALAQFNMYFATLNGSPLNLTYTRYVAVLIHELGHLLGMGHQFNEPFDSMMGSLILLDPVTGVFDLNPFSYPHDVAEFQARYPCGCELTAPLTAPRALPVVQIGDTHEHCPVCQGVDL